MLFPFSYIALPGRKSTNLVRKRQVFPRPQVQFKKVLGWTTCPLSSVSALICVPLILHLHLVQSVLCPRTVLSQSETQTVFSQFFSSSSSASLGHISPILTVPHLLNCSCHLGPVISLNSSSSLIGWPCYQSAPASSLS